MRSFFRSYRSAGGLPLHLHLHQVLNQQHQALLEGVYLRVIPVLVQKLPERDPPVGHRLGSSFWIKISTEGPAGGLVVKGARWGHPHTVPPGHRIYTASWGSTHQGYRTQGRNLAEAFWGPVVAAKEV